MLDIPEEKIPERKTLLVSLLVLLLFATPFALEYFTVVERTNVYSTQVQVMDVSNNSSIRVGLDTGSNFDYGELPLGSNLTKSVNFSSVRPSLVNVDVNGNISRYLYYDNRFLVNGTEEFTMEIDPQEPGNYSGEVEIKIQTPNNLVGEKWVKLKSRL